MPTITYSRLRALLIRACSCVLVLAGLAEMCLAAPPQLTAITPRGWKAGANEVTLGGANFTETTRLLIDIPGADVALKPESKPAPNQLQVVVTIPPETPPGVYEARIVAEDGVSSPQVIVVDQLPTVAEVEPNNEPAQAQPLALPAAVEGRLGGVESDVFAIDGKQGERLVVEIAGRRLGCNIKPVLRLYNANRLELAVAHPSRRLGGDARLIATLPADGRYFVELHDLVYRGDNNQYRLMIGDLQVADGVFPLGGRRGTTLPVRWFGGTVGSSVESVVNLPSESNRNVTGVVLPSSPTASPLPLPLVVSNGEDVEEQDSENAKPQAITAPVVINGRLSKDGEEDRYQLAVTAGSKLRVWIQADRVGSPLDAVVKLLKEDGGVLITQDDGPGTADPDFFYTVPAETASLLVSVTDLHGRGGEAFVYRLAIEEAVEGDFELTLLNPLVNIPAGGSASVRVRATRREYNGPIRLKVAGELPPGLKLSGAEIGGGVTDTFLSLTAPADAPLKAGTFTVVGEAGPVENPTLVRVAKLAPQPIHEGLPWLQTRLAGAVTGPGLLALDVEPGEPFLLRGVEYVATVKVRRTPEQTGPINLAVQTSQVPAGGQGQVAPVANQVIAENATEGVVKFTVPANAPEIPLSFVVTGQLLDAKEKKTIVATAEAAGVATRIAFPFSIELTAPGELTRGVRHLIAGKLVRVAPFNQPVQVALTGLPATVQTEPVIVEPGLSEFRIPILIPPAQAAGALANVKVTGTWATNPPLVSAPVDVPLTVSAADR